MNKLLVLCLTTLGLLGLVSAECPNACSAHGKCGAYDMCLCYRNWMSNDCSERICQFGLAHVDTPKGDLDASSGALSGPDEIVVKNDAMYPFGTTEQYAAATDIDGIELTNTAHEYRECSNKGICDRVTGTCACFEGYDGSACQRASCPSNADGVCSGHGTCETISEIAARDFNNIYRLWDEDSTMGCVCDGGYTGADCSERICKYGADPLYYDDEQNIRYSNYTYHFYAKSAGVSLEGNYSLIFYDYAGEDWQTEAIPWNASCEVVTAALESLPNNVIPANSVRCYKSDKTTSGTTPGQEVSGIEPIYDANMYLFSKYTIAFPENPGKLKQIAINKYLDGSRPTLYTDETDSTLGWHIYPNGFIGEDVDLVPDRCEDVTVTLVAGTTTHYLDGLTTAETKLLKKCLGDGNGDSSDNVDVYDWDYGDVYNPHLIKLIDATQDSSITTVDPNGDIDTDYALTKYPITQLCANSFARNKSIETHEMVDEFGIYYCRNTNPPGFYAVLFYDESVSTTNPFRIYTRAAQDYDSTTEFYLYTTQGYLQLVNPNGGVYTTNDDYSSSVKVDMHYSSLVYMTDTTTTYPAFAGNMDCETTTIGTYGALACLNKNDYVMFLDTDTTTTTSLAANPVYPNIYQVKKISREEKTFKTFPSLVDSDRVRYQIQLDYSMNSKFVYDGGFSVSTDTTASVYKFFPATNNADGGYRYAAECSNRGICNKNTGLCECFPGYGTDNCGSVFCGNDCS